MRKVGVYLGSYRARHLDYLIVYNDIDRRTNPDLCCDMLDVDLSPFDFVIATPPCNWWSRANYRRDSSIYALNTKHLLIDILHKLSQFNKPFIVENVRNDSLFKKYGLFDLPDVFVYRVGRHTYWSNVVLDFSNVVQVPKIDYKNGMKRYLSSQNLPPSERQGTEEVHEIIDIFLKKVCKCDLKKNF